MNRKLIAGNWKMNGLPADLQTIREVAGRISSTGPVPDVLLCVPATLLSEAARVATGTPLHVGGQTCHTLEKGAYTGDVSARMLREAGAKYVIVGHSERRSGYGETNEIVAAQAAAALGAGLTPIICVGETLDQRNAGETLAVVEQQLSGSLPKLESPGEITVAYEPLWAIGTGKVATPAQIAEVHGFIRRLLVARFGEGADGVRILYGGSLNPGNAAEILPIPDVDGGLIGGASLKAADFLAIYATASALNQ